MKTLENALISGTRLGLSKTIKSDFAKQTIKGIANKYIDQALDSVTGDISRKLDPLHKGSGTDVQNIYQHWENCIFGLQL